MTSTNRALSGQSGARDMQKLEVRYGDIGISAVAAATRYCGTKTKASPAAGAAEEHGEQKTNELAGVFA